MDLIGCILFLSLIFIIIEIYTLDILKQVRDADDLITIFKAFIQVFLLSIFFIILSSSLLFLIVPDEQIKQHWGASQIIEIVSELIDIKNIFRGISSVHNKELFIDK
jgi:hypothetical protein